MSSLCQLWGKGALARDAVPAPVTTRWKLERKPLASTKARVMKKAIRVCMIEEKRKEKLELEKQRKEAEAKGLTIQDLESKDNVHLKIVQHEEKLDELQKEKHKLFLTLKKVLLNEKKQQIAAAPQRKAPENAPGPSVPPQSPSMRPRMSQEDWGGPGFGRPTMAGAPRMYMPPAAYAQGGMRQTPSMLQQFGGYAQQQQASPQALQSPQQQSAPPGRPTMLHSGPRDYYSRGGRGGPPARGLARGRGQFGAASPAWRYQDTRGRGAAYRKDGYYSGRL